MVEGVWGANVYLLVEDDGLTLVDAALPGCAGRILRYVEQLGRRPSEIRYILLTHAHPDHTGSISALLKRCDARVLAHAGDVRVGRDGRRRLHYPGQVLSLPGPFPFVGRKYAHELVEDGSQLPLLGGLRVLHTPGHTPGSISLYLEKLGVLLSGDIFISDGRRFTRPVPFPGTDWRAYRVSAERLAELDFQVACVGHGMPIASGAAARAREMLDDFAGAASWRKVVRKLRP